MTNDHMLYAVADIRRIEQSALAALPAGTLMRRAGAIAAEAAQQLMAHPDSAGRILVLAGPGNNGGDALEAATQLGRIGCAISIVLIGDPANLPADAQQAWQRAKTGDAVFIDSASAATLALTDWDLVIDGLFGIGLARAISGEARDLIAMVNTLHCPVLALDVPSGLNADTGKIVGDSSGIALRATHTITFIGDKPGLHTADGRDYAGKVHVARLEIEPAHFLPSHMQLNRIELFAEVLQPRLQNSHKGNYGDVIVLGGAHGMAGAAILAGRTAARCGAGRVFIASLDDALVYDCIQPELMCRRPHEMDFNSATVIAGPGLGSSRAAHDFLARAIASKAPLMLDADALNLLAVEAGLQQGLLSRNTATLLTPHPLEAARLLETTTAQVQADRLAAARILAAKFNAIVVLKGSGTVIAAPNGELAVNTTGNAALATAGTGDVLSGLCGALLAQNCSVWQAALAAVWLHGKAADDMVESGIGPIGIGASELIPAIRTALNRLANQVAAARPAALTPNGQPRL